MSAAGRERPGMSGPSRLARSGGAAAVRRSRAGLRRRHGHHAARGGRGPGPVAARAQPVRSRPGRDHPRQLPDRRARTSSRPTRSAPTGCGSPTTASPTRSRRSTGRASGWRGPPRTGPGAHRAGGRVGLARGDRAAAAPGRRGRADGGAARADPRPGRGRRRRPADPGDVRLPGRARRGGLGGRRRVDQPAADRAGHVRRRRAHPRRRDAARGRGGAVRAAGRDDRHQLHDRPAADARRRRGPGPVLGGAGQRPAERRAAAPDRAALVRVRHRRRLLLPVPGPVRRRRGDPGRRLLRHHADAHQGRRRGAAHRRRSRREARAAAAAAAAARARVAGRASAPPASGARRPARSPTTWPRAVRGGRRDHAARRGGWAGDAERAAAELADRGIGLRVRAAAGERPDAHGLAEHGARAAAARRRGDHRHGHHLGQDDHVAPGRPARRARARHPLGGVAPPARRRCSATTRRSTAPGRSTRSA